MVPPGNDTKISLVVGVFFRVGEDKYLKLDHEDPDIFTQDLEWIPPTGITILEKSVSARLGRISWSTYGAQTTVEGVILTFSGRARVEANCPEGDHWILVGVPAILYMIYKYKNENVEPFFRYAIYKPLLSKLAETQGAASRVFTGFWTS